MNLTAVIQSNIDEKVTCYNFHSQVHLHWMEFLPYLISCHTDIKNNDLFNHIKSLRNLHIFNLNWRDHGIKDHMNIQSNMTFIITQLSFGFTPPHLPSPAPP
jgi:hypothetical protein